MLDSNEEETHPALIDLQDHLSSDSMQRMALPVAAIKSLLGVIKRSEANTMMGLQEELVIACNAMVDWASTDIALVNRSKIAIASGCEMFVKYVTRCFLELPEFDECKKQVLERGERFAGISLAARDRIAELGQEFIQDGQTVLVHGFSRVVSALLIKAAARKNFNIIILEGRPDAGGARAARVYNDAGIPCTVVLDSAMGYVMERVDLVIVGAEGVVENGGVVNKIGTFALGIVAKELGKPFYVAAESYKFARLFPLNQQDLPDKTTRKLDFVDTTERKNKSPNSLVMLPESIKVENPPCDFTPASFISLLFTDLGILTPSAVSDELIRLYQ